MTSWVRTILFAVAGLLVCCPAVLGVTTNNQHFGVSGNTERVVPLPVADAVPPIRKKGTSAPNSLPICLKCFSPSPNRHNAFNANSVIAAFEDPGAFAVERWMASEKHRANILSTEFRAMAIGMYIAADGSVFLTQTFITR